MVHFSKRTVPLEQPGIKCFTGGHNGKSILKFEDSPFWLGLLVMSVYLLKKKKNHIMSFFFNVHIFNTYFDQRNWKQ